MLQVEVRDVVLVILEVAVDVGICVQLADSVLLNVEDGEVLRVLDCVIVIVRLSD